VGRVIADALIPLYVVLAPVTIPALVMLLLFINDGFESCARTIRRRRKARLTGGGPEPAGPPLEKIAEDLQRLGLARRGALPGSMGYEIMTREYDKHLVEACTAIGVAQSLYEHAGIDLALERMRVEDELVAAGLVLVPAEVEQDAD
jgi:hypothetical protein